MMLTNLQNYGPYSTYIERGQNLYINTNDINIGNVHVHRNSILNIFRDGIETNFVNNLLINVDFGIDSCYLSLHDYFINLIMWELIVSTGEKIMPYHIFFDDDITGGHIKSFIDEFLLEDGNKIKEIPMIKLNNIINDTLYGIKYLDEFSLYYGNTIQLKDDIDLMNSSQEAWSLYHLDMSKTTLEDAKKYATDAGTRLVELISAPGSTHALANAFRAKEAINKKQFIEFAINVGPMPDGLGGVYPIIPNNSFLNGGLDNIYSYFMESSAGIQAQILSKNNVGSSGYFARLTGLNNSDTILYHDPLYDCGTRNFERITIKSQKMLNMLKGRYYRYNEMSLEYKISKSDTHLIGKEILLRSPMKCASKSKTGQVCYKCYGDLAYINNDINIGKIAAELLSAVLTQILLSAKHLLESKIQKMFWSKMFNEFCVLDYNVIKFNDENMQNGFKLVIDPNAIESEDEYDKFNSNEFISSFIIRDRAGNEYPIHTTDIDNLYISSELNDIIREKAKKSARDMIELDYSVIQDIPLFLVKLNNDEISKTLAKIKNIMDKTSVTKTFDSNTILQELLDTVIEGGLNISSVHLEILLSNQFRQKDSILLEPEWEYPVKESEINILTLKQALYNNPSVSKRLAFERIAKNCYNPLTFKCNKASFLDAFLCKNPLMLLKQEEQQ